MGSVYLSSCSFLAGFSQGSEPTGYVSVLQERRWPTLTGVLCASGRGQSPRNATQRLIGRPGHLQIRGLMRRSDDRSHKSLCSGILRARAGVAVACPIVVIPEDTGRTSEQYAIQTFKRQLTPVFYPPYWATRAARRAHQAREGGYTCGARTELERRARASR